jgi:uncharacterized membrane protein
VIVAATQPYVPNDGFDGECTPEIVLLLDPYIVDRRTPAHLSEVLLVAVNWLLLIALPIIVAGFALRFPVSCIVLTAGIATGFVAGMPIVGSLEQPGILDTLGKAFTDYRAVTLFVLALPAVGLSERYGLHDQARRLVAATKAATVGRVQFAYHLMRFAIAVLGIRLGSGHVTFSRPIVVPMALEAAGVPENAESAPERTDRVKAASAASDNYANFFGQNLFPAAAGVAVVARTLDTYGYKVDLLSVSLWTIPAAVVSIVLAAVQYRLLDRWLERRRNASLEQEALREN